MRRHSQGHKVPLVYENSVNNQPKKKKREFYLQGGGTLWAPGSADSCLVARGAGRAGGGNGNPLQCSCLENLRGGGVWWADVYGVTQSWTRLTTDAT